MRYFDDDIQYPIKKKDFDLKEVCRKYTKYGDENEHVGE